jgi:hypothetical protein
LDFAGNTVSFAGIEEGSTTTIKVTSLRLIGVPDEETPDKTPIMKGSGKKQQRAIVFAGVSSNKLNLKIATGGIYQVEIFSVNGKRIFSAKNTLSTGTNYVAIPKNLAKGIAVIRVSGLNAKIEQKIVIK